MPLDVKPEGASTSNEKSIVNSSSPAKDTDPIIKEVGGKSKKKSKEVKPKKDEKEKIPFKLTEVFKKYGTRKEHILMLIGFIAAIGFGGSLPVQTIFFGDVIDAFNNYDFTVNHPEYFPPGNYESLKEAAKDRVNEDVTTIAVSFVILGAFVFVCAYLLQSLWCYTGANQSRRVRLKLFDSMLHQPVSWHDGRSPGELTTHLVTSMSLIQDGVNERFVSIFNYLASFVCGFIVAFVKSWKMTLVLLSVFPILVIVSTIFAKVISNSTNSSQKDYAEAGGVAQEVLSNIRTVTSYNAQKHYFNKFNKFLQTSLKTGTTKGIKTGLAMATTFFLIFANYALGFWYGSTLVVSGELTGGTVLNVFFAVMFGGFVLGNIAPAAAAVSSGNGAYVIIKDIIDTAPLDQPGKQIDLKGHIIFKDVDFTYPTRPDQQVLNKFNLTILPGQQVALVGSSGSGKSTIVQLLLKFYKPQSGTITVDGVDLQELDTTWWRSYVGLVEQNPILFDTTIAENILLGLKVFSDDINGNMTKIEKVSEMALAHDFVKQFPKQYLTNVGEKGGQLSGGQRQRIAIARALIKDPIILLLDEATSALDSTSEKIVQQALDSASSGRTTITIAHRLSTIKDADVIVVMSKGFISETGTYNELVGKQGDFYALVKAQELKTGEGVATKGKELKMEEQVTVHESKEKEIVKIPLTKWPLVRLFKLQKSELPLIIVGVIGATLNGALFPCFNLFFSEILSAFAKPKGEVQEEANFWAYMFLVLATVAFFANWAQMTCFTISGEKLTFRIRQTLFEAYMKQDISFFDDPTHTSGILSASIADEAERIKALTGDLLGIIFQFTSTIAVGLGIGFYYNAELTGLILIVMPFTALQGYMEIKILEGFNQKQKKMYESASQIACDAVANIRTVLSLNREKEFLKYYKDRTELPHQINVKGGFTTALMYAFSQASVYLVMAYAFWIGKVWLINDRVTSGEMFIVIFSIIFSAMGLGQILSQAKNIFKAADAAKNYFEIIDREPPIKFTEAGEKPVDVQGKASIQKIKFTYPQRLDTMVINDISQIFQTGKTTALVGSSGNVLF